jgi:hypothetical protein
MMTCVGGGPGLVLVVPAPPTQRGGGREVRLTLLREHMDRLRSPEMRRQLHTFAFPWQAQAGDGPSGGPAAAGRQSLPELGALSMLGKAAPLQPPLVSSNL